MTARLYTDLERAVMRRLAAGSASFADLLALAGPGAVKTAVNLEGRGLVAFRGGRYVALEVVR